MTEQPQFQVLDKIERLPGVYMYKNGELVEYDGSNVGWVVVQERWTLRECKKMGIQLPKIIEESTL